MATAVPFDVEPLTASFGAVLRGLDLTQQASDADYAAAKAKVLA